MKYFLLMEFFINLVAAGTVEDLSDSEKKFATAGKDRSLFMKSKCMIQCAIEFTFHCANHQSL